MILFLRLHRIDLLMQNFSCYELQLLLGCVRYIGMRNENEESLSILISCEMISII